MQKLLKNWVKHIVAILILLVATVVYFSPSVIDGKVLRQGDNIKATGMGASQMKQYEETAQEIYDALVDVAEKICPSSVTAVKHLSAKKRVGARGHVYKINSCVLRVTGLSKTTFILLSTHKMPLASMAFQPSPNCSPC